MRVWLLLLLTACSTPPKTLAPAQSSLSETIARAMKGRAGAVVVMDGRGQILAQHNPQTAQQRAFPVGSAIKPFIAKAIKDRSRTYYCQGAYRIGSLKLLCTHSRQKYPLDLAHALALSCNGYFASLREELNQGEPAALLQKHGFSRSRALFNPQTDEERANFLIGETDRISMTPVAFTEAMLSLANSCLPQEIVAGLKGTVEYGTGADGRWRRTLSRPGIVVLGKTGSPTIPGDVLTHGWFTALVCKERQREEGRTSPCNEKPLEVDFAITVFLEIGRGHEAATIAAEIVDAFLESTSNPKGGLDVALFSPLEPREALLQSNSMRLRDASGRLLLQSKRLRLSAAGSGILVQPEGGEGLVLERLLVEAGEGISVRVEGALPRSHRGWISVTLGKRPQTLLILERVDLESYVAGVVTAEMPEETEIEALKAQAVAARSFAASALFSRRHTYGLCSSTHCQRYEGNANPQALEASRQTAGEYLLDTEGRPARTLFHACCGGKRLTAERVWGEQAITPVSCKYCTGHNLWQRKFSKREVMAVFESNNPRNFRLISRDGTCLRLEWSSPNQHISCGDLLESLGVPSPPNNLLMQGDEVLLSGQGKGHAVGLCQHAAHSLATEGRDYRQILSEFYPHLSLSKYRPSPDSPSAQTFYEKSNVSVTYTAPNTTEDAREVAEIALEAAKELEQYSNGLKFEFLLHPDPSSFRKATGLAGDSAGASTGGKIHLQPLKRLRELKMLRQTIRHEMMHLAIERVGGLSTARWFHEGYAVIFAGEQVSGGQPMSLQELECALLKASSLEQRRALYSAAASRVQNLLREGEQKLWRDLAAGRFRSPGCR